MYVTKNEDGTYRIEDEPIQLDGAEAQTFRAQMREGEDTRQSPERQKFLAECRSIYERTESQLTRA